MNPRDPTDTKPVERHDWSLDEQTRKTGRIGLARVRHENYGGPLPPPDLTIESEVL